MEELDIIIEPELEFTLKKCGDVVPYGITPEERAKLAGIEEDANDYIHPDTHPASILDVVDVVAGAANKFLNERGEMVAVATSSIGVTGSPLYASTANSDVAGYKSLVGTPQTLETEILLTAKSTDGIVWGAKYLSAPFTQAGTIPTTAYGFDYWRKVSAANGTSRKHLRVFLYRAGVETNIITPLASPDIDETEFTERQISYIFPELALLAGDRIGIQEGFSTTHANNVTLTYIVGDGRGWFMRLPLPLKHESLTNKDSEAAFQHIDERINEIPAKVGAASYTLLNRRQNLITGTLPNGVNSTLVIPALIAGERNEVILHFKTNATAAPTLVYLGFTPVWLNGNAISMKINKQYTIVFEQVNGVIKTSWGEY